MKNQIPHGRAFFPISVVKELTSLSARQIRYYEQQGLISPERNGGNQRLFSMNDIERCAKIKELIDQGINIAGVKAVLKAREEAENKEENTEKQLLNKQDMEKLLRKYLEEQDT